MVSDSVATDPLLVTREEEVAPKSASKSEWREMIESVTHRSQKEAWMSHKRKAWMRHKGVWPWQRERKKQHRSKAQGLPKEVPQERA